MKESITLGPVPGDEPCAQLGEDGYAEKARKECSAYIKQLTRLYQQLMNKELPEGCRLKIGSNPHDFGVYYEVEVVFDDNNEASVEAAYWLDENCPAEWDEEAKKELK